MRPSAWAARTMCSGAAARATTPSSTLTSSAQNFEIGMMCFLPGILHSAGSSAACMLLGKTCSLKHPEPQQSCKGGRSLMLECCRLELDNLASFLKGAVAYKNKIGFKGELLLEPKPQVPPALGCPPLRWQASVSVCAAKSVLATLSRPASSRLHIQIAGIVGSRLEPGSPTGSSVGGLNAVRLGKLPDWRRMLVWPLSLEVRTCLCRSPPSTSTTGMLPQPWASSTSMACPESSS